MTATARRRTIGHWRLPVGVSGPEHQGRLPEIELELPAAGLHMAPKILVSRSGDDSSLFYLSGLNFLIILPTRIFMRANEKDPPLKPEEIARGMFKCRENAVSLIEEAVLLDDHGKHARAYFLAHSACEELAKFFILKIAGNRVCHGDPPDWKRFWKRFRSHDSKMSQIDAQLAPKNQNSVASTNDLSNALSILLSGGLFVRHASLYVDIGTEKIFRSPAELIFETPFPAMVAAANMASNLAWAVGRTVEELLEHLHAPPSSKDKAAAVMVLTAAIEKLKSSGVNREEATKLIERAFSSQ